MTAKRNTHGAKPPIISQYNGKGLLYAFVYRIAQRRVLSELKRRQRSGVSIEGSEVVLAAPDTDHVELDDLRASLATMLQGLSDRERIVLRMTCDGCSNSEIAAVITAPGKPPIHDGRISHIRNDIVRRLRDALASLSESVPRVSTLISDLLAGNSSTSEVSP
jgi:hypothetical protein